MAELDPRDKILQDHTPTLMVPRFGALVPMAKSGHRYLVAKDGLWLEVLRPWLHARVPIGETFQGLDDHQLPFGEIERLADYKFRPEDIQDVQARFHRDAVAAMPNEFAAWGVYDEASGTLDYRPLIAIDASAGGIKFHRPALADGEHLAIDLHSHGRLDAFFSSTDDEDDRGEVKLSVVVGKLDEEPRWASRLCLLGVFIGDEEARGEHEGEFGA